MRKASLAALVAVSALAGIVPSPTHAQWSLGARVGYMHGLGDVGGALELEDYARSQLPLQLDVGYRFGQVTLGGYFSYGVAFVSGDLKDDCDAFDADCSASGLRFGLQALFSFQPKQQVDPWLGLGFGYESLSAEDEVSEMTARGLEWLILQGGIDFHASPRFRVGPYASFSLGQYSEIEIKSPEGAGEGEIPDKDLHQWLTVGLRGEFDF